MICKQADEYDCLFRGNRSPKAAIHHQRALRSVVANPIKREVQPNGRIRLWGRIPELGNRVVRVILLPDGNTIHNAFLDRGYKG